MEEEEGSEGDAGEAEGDKHSEAGDEEYETVTLLWHFFLYFFFTR